MSVRVYIVEDHALLREALKDYVDALPGVVVCGVAADAESALEELVVDGAHTADVADVALVDLTLPGMGGLELIERLGIACPGLACVVVSGDAEAGIVESALRLGAAGFVLKGDPREIRAALQRFQDSPPYVSRSIVGGPAVGPQS